MAAHAAALAMLAVVLAVLPPQKRPLPDGRWGGEHIAITVTAKGAELEFDCANGEISVPLLLDGNGRFSVEGVFMPQHGGPIRSDVVVPPVKVRYDGALTGKTLSLTITRLDTREMIGKYAAELGEEPRVYRCV